MICPKCGAENLRGKLLCYKCGAKLMQAPKVAPQAGKEPVRKKRGFRALYYLFLLIFLGVIFYLMLQKPEIKSLEVSPEAARILERKLYQIERAALTKEALQVEVTEEEINSQLAERVEELRLDEEYTKQNISVDNMQIELKEDKFKTILTLKVKGKSVYLSLGGSFVLIDGKLGLAADRIVVGKMPLPPAILRGLTKQIRRGKNLPLPTLPSGVRSIRIEGGKLIIETGPGEEESPVKVEVKPAPEKRVLTEEELEELRRKREENEAKSWLQVGENFANAGMYDSAVEYYQKIINKYPESEQAKEARQRVEEIKTKLESGE